MITRLIAVLLFLLSHSSNPLVPSANDLVGVPKQKNLTTQKQQQLGQGNRIVAVVKSGWNLPESTPGDQQEQAASYDAGRDTLYRVYLVATIVGVAGGFIGLIVLICQTRNIGRQTQTLVSAERAWILTDVAFSFGSGRVVHSAIPTESGQQDGTPVAIRLRCRNDGKTPCWITEIRGRLEITSNLSETPDIENTEILYEGLIPMGVNTPFHDDYSLTFWKAPHHRSGHPFDEVTVAYGVVRYIDAVKGDKRETFWGYKILGSRQIMRLPKYPAYNKST